MIAVYSRANHPMGWGMPEPVSKGNAGGHGKAHGYSILFIKCKSRKQIKQVSILLSTKGLPEPFNHPYQWYGGIFEKIVTIPGNKVNDCWHGQKIQSRGDNRYVGIYDAEDLLDGNS